MSHGHIRLVTGRLYGQSFNARDLETLEAFILGQHDRSITLREANTDLRLGSVAVRHDIDHSGSHAVRYAERERSMGINSTYFVLPTAPYFASEGRDTALRLAELGFEVGIHNDAVTLAGGDLDMAAAIMAVWVDEFRGWGIDVRGCADHGGSFDNTKLWRWRRDDDEGYHPEDFGLEYEAYLLSGPTNYISDNRGMWRSPLARDHRQTHLLVHPCHWMVP